MGEGQSANSESQVMRMIAELSLAMNDVQRKLAALDTHLNALGNFVTQSGQMMADKFQKIENHVPGLKLTPPEGKLELVPDKKEVKPDAANTEGKQNNEGNG